MKKRASKTKEGGVEGIRDVEKLAYELQEW